MERTQEEQEQAAADAQYEEHLIKSGDLSHMSEDEKYVYRQLQQGVTVKQAIGQLEAMKDERDFQMKVRYAIRTDKDIQTFIRDLIVENKN